MEILAVGQRNAVDRKSPVSKSAGDVCPPSPQLLRPCNPGFKKKMHVVTFMQKLNVQ